MAMAPIFEQALHKVFANWTVINLAVEQGWGGRNTTEKKKQLVEEVYQGLADATRKKRPPTHDNTGDVNSLADFLAERSVQLFSAELDDGSEEEVSHLILRLYSTCLAGDFSFAEQFLQDKRGPADLSRCQAVDGIEYATEEDSLVDSLGRLALDGVAEDDESDGDVVVVDAAPLAFGATDVANPAPVVREPRVREEPVVDEDGFTTVSKSRGRR